MLQDINILQQLQPSESWVALGQVILIDLVLAGDNAIVIGMAAAGLPAAQRGRAILIGVVAATVMRIIFAIFAVQLLKVVGLGLAGGILLLWVCWKMWRELRGQKNLNEAEEVLAGEDFDHDGKVAGRSKVKTLQQAAIQIVVADVSMSLDNVLAVAGVARDHLSVLIIGLALSVGLMGLAASFVAKILHRYKWIGYVGFAIILYVALNMIYHGYAEIHPLVKSNFGL